MHERVVHEQVMLGRAAMRYALWIGDLGFAIYLWDCINGTARFPTLDVFFAN